MSHILTDHAAIRAVLDRFAAADPVRGTMFGTLRWRLTETAWAAVDGDRLAIRSGRDWPVVLSGEWTDIEALRALPDLRGVNGRRSTVEALLGLVAPERTARRVEQALYRLDELTMPTGVAGVASRADASSHDLVREWLAAFTVEAHDDVPRDLDVTAARVIDEGAWLWLAGTGEPVSLAGRRPVVHGSARVGPVFSAPEHRGRGYGSAVTAAATADVLADGAVPVLFTDLANPTSNKIYRALGYRFVEDRVVATFS